MKYVLYHGNCFDGFGAAFAAWKKLGNEGVKYIPCAYGYPPPEMRDAETIYVVDFSFDGEVLERWSETAKVVVLDHHKTALEKLDYLVGGSNPEVHLDMNRSGALMTWEYFHDEPAPMLIRWISDRDLWKFELPDSRRVHKALVSFPMNFELWDELARGVYDLDAEGRTCERLYAQLVENITKRPWMRKIGEHTVPVVNTSIAWSEVGHALLEAHPDAPFVASFTVFEDQVM